jgi:uncharacterized membrane protein HdeD (DUF308 family)
VTLRLGNLQSHNSTIHTGIHSNLLVTCQYTGLSVTLIIGSALIATGIAQALFAFKSKSFGVGATRFGFSVLAALTGLSLVAQPGAGLATITLLLAIWFVIDGHWFPGLNGNRSKVGAGWCSAVPCRLSLAL